MELSFGWAHTTLPVWVLAAVTVAASLIGAIGGYLLGSLCPATRLRIWLLRLAACFFVISSLLFSGLLAHLYVYATEPRLRGYSVSICFGDPHWNIAFGAFIPPLMAVGAFFLARRRRRRHRPVPSGAPTPAGA